MKYLKGLPRDISHSILDYLCEFPTIRTVCLSEDSSIKSAVFVGFKGLDDDSWLADDSYPEIHYFNQNGKRVNNVKVLEIINYWTTIINSLENIKDCNQNGEFISYVHEREHKTVTWLASILDHDCFKKFILDVSEHTLSLLYCTSDDYSKKNQWFVKKIVGHRMVENKCEVLVKWFGVKDEEWISTDDFEDYHFVEAYFFSILISNCFVRKLV